MSTEIKWAKPVRGSDLDSDFISNLDENIRSIYVWRRCLSLIPESILEVETFQDWISETISIPYIRTRSLSLNNTKNSSLSLRPGLIHVEEFKLGGGKLTESKLDEIKVAFSSLSKRRGLYNILDTSSDIFGPVLYVGQTDCLRTRLSEHIAQNSPYRKRLLDLGLSIEDTSFSYLSLPGSTKAKRELLEQVLTHLLIAPLTFRAG